MRALVLALLVAACASAAPSDELAPLGVALSCNAETEEICTENGCRPAEAGIAIATPVSISLPADTGPARFCIATGCSDARVVRVPLSRTPDWAARIEPEDGMAGIVTVSDDRRSFEYAHTSGAGVSTRWKGACAPAGS